ncbi:hypothetical protein E2C01_098316 [Portunus trituberculatus]|uniref:Uncharacterized protein n=1 Tax=Portunus trituberculatus TaxID=210409 RepID=A0A5B7KBT6_PORTR|nr:hypothetical protein [Portunus trituberculatus]
MDVFCLKEDKAVRHGLAYMWRAVLFAESILRTESGRGDVTKQGLHGESESVYLSSLIACHKSGVEDSWRRPRRACVPQCDEGGRLVTRMGGRMCY